MNKLRLWLIKRLCNGKIPMLPVDAIWELIDKENCKEEDAIRCDYIEALIEAAQTVRNYK